MTRRARALLPAFAVALAVLPGCGGGGEKKAAAPAPTRVADFPKAAGRTLAEIQRSVGSKGLILAPTSSVFHPGRNRFGFAIFDVSRKQLSNLPAVVYVAPKGGGKATRAIPARFESLAVQARFRSRSTAADPDAAKSLYVVDVDLPKAGSYDVLAVAKVNGKLVPALNAAGPIRAKSSSPVPAVGQRPPTISTPTRTDVAGDLSKIDTRLPPAPDLHQQSFADVVGKKPVVLLFATPALCQSRVCGPVVDIEEQVRATHGDGVAFIQQEIYKDNNLKKGFRPQVRRFGLPTEPWLFAIDRRGKVVARIEGAFSARELERAVAAAKR